MFTTHFANNGGIQTAYHDLNQRQQQPPLLLVHGFTGSKLDFISQMAWFVENHRVIAYDQRGHGESSNAEPYTLEQLGTDLIGLLDTLEIPVCHVLGHSLGGMVVMRAMLAHPERFKSVVLMDTAPYAMNLFTDEVRELLNQRVLQHGCASLLEGMRDQPQSQVVQRGIDFLGEAEHWRRIEVKLQQMDPLAFVQLGRELQQQTSQLDALANIDVPATVLVGEHDSAFIEASEAMHKVLPDSELHRIANAGHSPQYENADIWRDHILAHLHRAG